MTLPKLHIFLSLYTRHVSIEFYFLGGEGGVYTESCRATLILVHTVQLQALLYVKLK
jgi:hypothetical protein